MEQGGMATSDTGSYVNLVLCAGYLPEREEPTSLGNEKTLPDAIRRAETFVERERAAAIRVVDLSAHWRRQPPSDAQRGVLRRKGIPIPKGLTRGQASWMIGLLSARGRA
jgi:hypothetical protein